MNAKVLTIIATILPGMLAATAVNAEQGATLAWQQPGYVEEVVIVTAPRPAVQVASAQSDDVELAWQQPGYIQDVVVVSANRDEVLRAAGLALRAAGWNELKSLRRISTFTGTPAR